MTAGAGYYAVYRNPDLTGCYTPPIPGTSVAGIYPVACFQTPYVVSSTVTRIATTNTWTGGNIVTTLPAYPLWYGNGVTGRDRYQLLGCFVKESINTAGNLITANTGTNASTMTNDLCMDFGVTANANFVGIQQRVTVNTGKTA